MTQNNKTADLSPRIIAEKWTSCLKNEDNTVGPHWTIAQTNKIMAQHQISGSPWIFWAVLNSIYSDYCVVARKYGLGDKLDFYVDMAKAWLGDPDAVGRGGPQKAERYFEYVVER